MTTNSRAQSGLRRGPALLAIALLLAGCVNPNAIGVQQTGSISGRVIDANTQQPIFGAIVSVNSLTSVKSDASGVFTLARVPIGVQTLTIYANGYQTQTVPGVSVAQNQTSEVGLISLQPAT